MIVRGAREKLFLAHVRVHMRAHARVSGRKTVTYLFTNFSRRAVHARTVRRENEVHGERVPLGLEVTE